MAHIYDVGTRAWQPDQIEGWVASEVSSKNVQGDKVRLVFDLANGEVGEIALLLRLTEGCMVLMLTVTADSDGRNHNRRDTGWREHISPSPHEPGNLGSQ